MKTHAGMAVAVVLGLAAGCGGPAASTKPGVVQPTRFYTATAASAKAKEKLDLDNTLVCEFRPVTGSHIPTRICRTLRQVEKERIAAQEEMLRLARPGPQREDD